MTAVLVSLLVATLLAAVVSIPHRHRRNDRTIESRTNELYYRLFGTDKETPVSEKLANELQLIQPQNFVFPDEQGRYEGVTYGTYYEITSVSPTEINNDEVVTVHYKTNSPNSHDWIAAYSPVKPFDITQTVPVKYAYCDEDDNYLTKGEGFVTFNLTNLRSNVAFYYLGNSLSKPYYFNVSAQQVSFKNPNEPLRPRVVPTGDINKFSFLWSSNHSTTPTLKWGTSPGHYIHTVSATSGTIRRDQLCGAPATTVGWRDFGLIHTAFFEGIVNASMYSKKLYYIFGDAITNDFSEEYTFFLPPLPGQQPEGRGTRVILYDDLGRGCTTDDAFTWYHYGEPSIYTTMGVAEEINRGTVDGVYHGGDISYATGYEAVWDFFMDQIGPVAGSSLYLTTVGNHETDWPNTSSIFNGTDSGGECTVPTITLLPMPAPATLTQPWWSYDIGIIHFIGISTEQDFFYGSPQYQWLENDLKNVNRSVTPWIIFGGHRAMYINSDYGGTPSSDIVVMNALIASMEPLLWQYRVNLGFYGHNHVVQRQSAVFNKTVIQKSTVIYENGSAVHFYDKPQATVQTVFGTGGAKFTKNAMYGDNRPVWNEEVFYLYGYARVEAVNASYLTVEWVHAYNNTVMDRMVITQGDPNVPWVFPTPSPTPSPETSSSSSGLTTAQTAMVAVLVPVGTIGLGAVFYHFFMQPSAGSEKLMHNMDKAQV